MKKKNYNASWALPGHTPVANVSFQASHDANAKRQADKLARELGVTNTPRTLTRDGKLIEVLNKGTS